MLEYVHEGDIVVVESYSRIARNTKDLLSIVEMLEKKGVAFVSQKEKIDTSAPQGRLMLTIFASLAQFERECTLEREAEGIAIEKSEGRMGRPCVIPADNFAHIVAAWQEGKITAVEAMKKSQLSKATFYRKANIGTPKSEIGKRVIPLEVLLLTSLQPLKESGYIVGEGETALTQMANKWMWQRINKTINLHGATAHVLRHTYLTLLAGTNVDIKTLQTIAGHANCQITLERYIHPQTQKIVDAGMRMNQLLTT